MDTVPITRLHALDTEFLLMEDAASPMYIGSLCVFEGPVPSRDECERFVASRLATTPMHRKRVRTVPLGLGRPVLVDDAQFDIHYHVRRTVLAAPYTEASLWELMTSTDRRVKPERCRSCCTYTVAGFSCFLKTRTG
ncbi:MAG TPA: wax ester/triacylglycerol synthase domain-containing protein [Polyangiales bacterium]|nr:wax ester/triacylglycerol synthase domain-containing protein [Polyangiales bacterium]